MTPPPKDNILKEEKKRKRAKLLSLKLNPYPCQFKPRRLSADIKQNYAHLKAGEAVEADIKIAGRLILMRNMGKAAFFNVQDAAGVLQCYVKTQELDQESAQFFSLVDIGDIVGLQGRPFCTQKGELTVRAARFQILCKTVEPLPEKYHGLEDKELKYRRRYLQFIMTPEDKKIFQTRAQIIQHIRAFLDQKGFMEVDTPVLQPLYGGALAQPFSTHHRALDCPFYLKISPELYLKRLIVGGFEKVYELGKNFRNEGIDRLHSPEFTMLEYYEAYTDYLDQMTQFEKLVCFVVQKIKGNLVMSYQGRKLDLTPPWQRLSVLDGIQKFAGFSAQKMNELELFNKLKLLSEKTSAPVHLFPSSPRGELLMAIFELAAEKHLWDPVFITDFPKDVSPLTKEHRNNPSLVERFEPFIAGMELGNAYTELNDPVEQRQRLREQEQKRKAHQIAHPMDEDFAQAMDAGMPPTGGVGLGVERLVMLLADKHSLKDVILFPAFKPTQKIL